MKKLPKIDGYYKSKACKQGWLSGLEFSLAMAELLISEGGYVLDTGNWENVNAEVYLRLLRKIRKHPFLWKLFMVA